MKKLLCFGIVLVLAAVCSGQNISTVANIIQPAKHIDGSAITWTTHKYAIPSGQWAKAVELKNGSDSGYVGVHLVGDAAGTYYRMPVWAGQRSAAIFDVIDSATTTIKKDSLSIFIVAY